MAMIIFCRNHYDKFLWFVLIGGFNAAILDEKRRSRNICWTFGTSFM